jgi:hypothetical protein
MSFTYSRALVEAFSRATCSAGDASAPSNLPPTPDQSWWPDKTTEHSRLSRFGMTCEPSTADHGAALLTWWLAASRVRTSASQAEATDWTASDPAYGARCDASFAKYSPAELKWKTHQCSLVEGLDEFSETWPSWGLMRGGECWELPTLAPTTSETASGSWPTPTASCGTGAGHQGRKGGFNLQTAVRMWPTPVATMSKGSSPAALTRKSGRDRSNDRLDHAVMAADGGQLNPPWVEWLMGWPIGWTDLKPLGTDKFRQWLQLHGRS